MLKKLRLKWPIRFDYLNMVGTSTGKHYSIAFLFDMWLIEAWWGQRRWRVERKYQ